MKCALLPAIVLICVTVAYSVPDESASRMWHMPGVYGHVHHPDAGVCNNAILYDGDRPLAWIGLTKRRKQKTVYRYLLLFSPTEPFQSDSTRNKVDIVTSGLHKSIASQQFTWNDKQLTVKYEYEFDEETGKTITDALTINGQKVPDDRPRIYLIESGKGKVHCRPVNLELPDDVPNVCTSPEEWSPILKKAIATLSEKSPDVARFIEQSE